MLPLPQEERDPTATRTATAFAGDFLCRELIGALGRKADEARAELSDPNQSSDLVCQTFGSQRYTVPRRAMRETGGKPAGHSHGRELDVAGSRGNPGSCGRRSAIQAPESTCGPKPCSAR